MQTDVGAKAPDMTIVRDFDAPRELLFDLFTQAEHMTRWWGPAHFTTVDVESDPCPGGALRYVMVGPSGERYPVAGVYEDVTRPSRFIQVSGPGDGSFSVRHLVNFDTRNGKTRITINAWILDANEAAREPLSGMNEGWNQQLDKLVELIKP